MYMQPPRKIGTIFASPLDFAVEVAAGCETDDLPLFALVPDIGGAPDRFNVPSVRSNNIVCQWTIDSNPSNVQRRIHTLHGSQNCGAA